MISEELKKYDSWIARYPVDDNGTLIERYRPDIGVGWQYTSKGWIPGIEGYVDRDVFYKNYVAEEPSDKEKLSKEPKFVGKVTASALNVRTGAGTEYPNLREYPLLKRDNLIDVCDTREAIDGTKWYYVRIAGKYFGFVAARYIRCEMTPTSVGGEQQISISGGVNLPSDIASGRAHIVRWTMVLRRPKRSVEFWRISILINCGFRIVRKKKQCHIPDAASERV